MKPALCFLLMLGVAFVTLNLAHADEDDAIFNDKISEKAKKDDDKKIDIFLKEADDSDNQPFLTKKRFDENKKSPRSMKKLVGRQRKSSFRKKRYNDDDDDYYDRKPVTKFKNNIYKMKNSYYPFYPYDICDYDDDDDYYYYEPFESSKRGVIFNATRNFKDDDSYAPRRARNDDSDPYAYRRERRHRGKRHSSSNVEGRRGDVDGSGYDVDWDICDWRCDEYGCRFYCHYRYSCNKKKYIYRMVRCLEREFNRDLDNSTVARRLRRYIRHKDVKGWWNYLKYCYGIRTTKTNILKVTSCYIRAIPT
ncbi:hypothetical protein M8J77_026033 [Diaphorina citri]|nr:hypothetical protein M8J77_026033 [Diaphorina citri]